VAGQVVSGDIADNTIVNGDINSAAAIVYSKLSLANSIVNADVSPSAAIAKSKLAALAIVDADVAAGANINGAKLADASVSSAKLSGASVPAGSITTTEIANNTILDADVNAAAAIAVTKLAAGAVNTMLGTDGSGVVGFSASPAVSGTLKAFAGFLPSNQASVFVQCPVAAVSLPSFGSITPQIVTNGHIGIAFAIHHNTGRAAIFSLPGGINQVFLLAGDVTYWTTSISGNDSKMHCVYSGGAYYLENGYSAAQIVSVVYIGT